MAQIHKAEAIVLKKRQLLQQDFVITLFTKELGKIKVIAKGIKKLTSRRAPHLETGNLINVVLSQKSEPHYLQQTELTSAFSAIKDDTDKMNYAYVFFFILDRILPEGQAEESLFNMTKKFLIDLTI
jgi:DNA repair protein RecO (recombination protein O)